MTTTVAAAAAATNGRRGGRHGGRQRPPRYHIRKMGSELRLVQVCLKLPEATWRLPEPQRLKDTKLLSEKVDKFTRVLKDSRVALSSLENL